MAIVIDFRCSWIWFLVETMGIVPPQQAVCSSWLSGNTFWKTSHLPTQQQHNQNYSSTWHIIYTHETSCLLQSQKKNSAKATLTCTPHQVFHSWHKDHEDNNPTWQELIHCFSLLHLFKLWYDVLFLKLISEWKRLSIKET